MPDLPIQTEGVHFGPDTEPALSPATVGGDTFANDGKTYLWIVNAGVAQNMTAVTQRQCRFGDHQDLVKAIPGGTVWFSETFAPRRFNDLTGRAKVVFDDPSTVQIAAVRKPQLLRS